MLECYSLVRLQPIAMFVGKDTTNFIYFTRVGSVLLANIVQDYEIFPGTNILMLILPKFWDEEKISEILTLTWPRPDAIKLFMAVIKECV